MSLLGISDQVSVESAFASDSRFSPPRSNLGSHLRPADLSDPMSDSGVISEIKENLIDSEREADVALARKRSTVTLAAVAQARAALGKSTESIEAARECLQEILSMGQVAVSDLASARIAANVLLDMGDLETVVDFAAKSPISEYAKLELASALAEGGRIEDARDLAGGSRSVLSAAVRGYIELVDRQFAAAVPLLREALRVSPSDASSAFNLSVALERLGSLPKALRAAKRARSSDPSRLDYSLHLLELLFASRDLDAAASELERWGKGADSVARFLVAKARFRLMKSQADVALALLQRAENIASRDRDWTLYAEVKSNLLKMRSSRSQISRSDALEQLAQLHQEFPESDAVVANWAQVATRRADASLLARAIEDISDGASEARRAFLQYQLSTLVGDNSGAAEWASVWLNLEPGNPRAQTAYMVAVGIGQARWDEARSVALRFAKDPASADSGSLNNAAYVLAMSGHARTAIQLIKPLSEGGPVYRATLGLALLAAGEVSLGMKMYRMAADAVEKVDSATRSLMTAYQALIIRQLRLNPDEDERVRALALPAVALPDDWEDRPEFLRLFALSHSERYDWPLVVN